MRKIILCLMFIFIVFCIFSQEDEPYNIVYSGGETTLLIPIDYESLRTAYIDMSTLYLEERFGHENSIVNVEDLLAIEKRFFTIITNMEETIIDAINYKPSVKIYQSGLIAGMGVKLFNNKIVTITNIGYRMFLFESVTLDFIASYPWSFFLNVGVCF